MERRGFVALRDIGAMTLNKDISFIAADQKRPAQFDAIPLTRDGAVTDEAVHVSRDASKDDKLGLLSFQPSKRLDCGVRTREGSLGSAVVRATDQMIYCLCGKGSSALKRLRISLPTAISVTLLCYIADIALDAGISPINAQDSSVAIPSQSSAQTLPHLRLLRTLPATHQNYPLMNMVAGADNLTWSPDGQRLAAYIKAGGGIAIWTPDGTMHQEIPRYNEAALTASFILGFVSGHRELLAGPSASDSDRVNLRAIHNVAMSVLDATTGAIVQNVPGLNPQGTWQENIVTKAAISPDQRLVAAAYDVMFGPSIERRVGIYETNDWRRVMALPFGGDHSLFGAQALAFSPDGKMLAIAYTDTQTVAQPDKQPHGYVDIFEVGSWKLKQKIGVFLENPPRYPVALGSDFNPAPRWAPISHVSFNHDGSMIVVASSLGGTFWHYPNGQVAPTGEGTPKSEYPADPIRVFRVIDGQRVNSAGLGFTGGPLTSVEIAWSPRQNLIAFLDSDHVLYFWNPMQAGVPHAEQKFERDTTAIAFSPDGTLLGQSFGEGVRLFELQK